jgi:hypothetical protein
MGSQLAVICALKVVALVVLVREGAARLHRRTRWGEPMDGVEVVKKCKSPCEV